MNNIELIEIINSERFGMFTNQIKNFEKLSDCNIIEYKVPRQYGVYTYLEAMLNTYERSLLFTSIPNVTRKYKDVETRVIYMNDNNINSYDKYLRGMYNNIIFIVTVNNKHDSLIKDLVYRNHRMKFVVFNQIDIPLI